MKIIEHLRALQDAFMRAHTDDDVRRTGREFGAEMVAQSDRLLAVVEAQAAEIAAWREVDVAASAVMKIMRQHGGGALVEEMKEVAMQKKDIVRGTRIATDAALRALEGGER